jgi:hypothetical protein
MNTNNNINQFPEDQNQEQNKAMSTSTKVLIASLSLAALGIGSYSIYKWMKRNKNEMPLDEISEQAVESDTTSSANVIPVSPKNESGTTNAGTGFPLKKGSKGELVRTLQQTLINQFGASILPKYGADGHFGSELIAALKSKSLPERIDESQYKVLTQPDYSTTANSLFSATQSKNFSAAISALKGVRNTEDYKQVSEKFKAKYLNGVRTTLVTGLLQTFTDASQKQKLNLEFSRIGLEYDGNKWSIPTGVSGINRRQIKSVTDTNVWQNANYLLKVKKGTVLGMENFSKNGFTCFSTPDGFRLFVLTKDVCYCKS